MNTVESAIAACIDQLQIDTNSDFAILGMMDSSGRRLRWSRSAGRTSERTNLVEQKATAGLSGKAIRSGRQAAANTAMSDRERFKLGEPILLTEQLRIAVSVPIAINNKISGVVLIGRRSDSSYLADELNQATHAAIELASLLE
ncbi:nitrogen regulatory protein A [Paenibacillus endophyticus]|uniref:Nitrogen regulatory protein A n=1 Tax=Paenibacillus endophyticus TaxID=1294268 RepID=A0A7W5G8W8_9BACL|nr:GAF domain-containing protein [Paenibacillus endophyticus]MBB3150713.1 nitrogen regulatory protein A [Paenibacillus endophyticus]